MTIPTMTTVEISIVNGYWQADRTYYESMSRNISARNFCRLAGRDDNVGGISDFFDNE